MAPRMLGDFNILSRSENNTSDYEQTVDEIFVWNNLGLALLYSAQYRDALSCFEHVIHLCGSDRRYIGSRESAFTNIALCCLHLEDFGRGLKASETAVLEAREPHST